MHNKKSLSGFTLLEILLVLAIVSGISVIALRYLEQRTLQFQVDRAAMQMQAILNAASGYYVANSSWPTSISAVMGAYNTTSPWGKNYTIISPPPATPTLSAANFIISTSIPGANGAYAAIMLSGRLPASMVTTDATTCFTSATACAVQARISIPAQILNSTQSVNFTNIYKHGACVPAPQCPGWDYVNNNCVTAAPDICFRPTIFVVPIAISGLNDGSTNSTIYPISSFTAYALGNTGSGKQNFPTSGNPGLCGTPSTGLACVAGASGSISATTSYWRVCVNVITSKGALTNNSSISTSSSSVTNNWGNFVQVLAITRCMPSNEQSGSDFSVFL